MRVNQRKLKTKLAEEYFSGGDYHRALNFIARFQGAERRKFRSKEFEAHYRLGVQFCAENSFSAAHKHFSEAVQLATTPTDLKLCEARLATLKRLILSPAPQLPQAIRGRRHDIPGAEGKSFYEIAVSEAVRAILPAERLTEDALRPEIDRVFAVGAFKSWWDTENRNPYSQAVKLAQKPQSKILLEPLGILLAEFVAETRAAVVRQNADFICPIPAEAANPESWRYRGLSIIADVMGRRFGIPLVSVLRPEPGNKIPRGRHSHFKSHFTVSHPELVAGRHILLVDDITSYRKTVRYAAAELKAAGAASVSAIILAITEPTHSQKG